MIIALSIEKNLTKALNNTVLSNNTFLYMMVYILYMKRSVTYLNNEFDFLGEHMSTNENVNEFDAIDYVSKNFDNSYHTSYDYKNIEPVLMKSKPLKKYFYKDKHFVSAVTIAEFLMQISMYGGNEKYDLIEPIKKQLLEFDRRGQLCCYISIVLYSLLKRRYDVQYYQGLYYHKARADYPDFLPWGNIHAGAHAFITVDGSIIDVSIRQEEMFFDFKGKTSILGNIPEGMKLYGWKENIVTVSKYINDILKFSNMTLKEWIKLLGDTYDT